MLAILVLALSLMVCSANVSGQVELGTAFTYQGFLKDLKKDKPADGFHDFQFSLFDANDAVSPVSDIVTANDVNVIEGYFRVRLDFGADVFAGYERWLQIDVRETGSGNSFTPLAPRLELTLTPYAIYALDANTVDGFDAGNIPDQVAVSNGTVCTNLNADMLDDHHAGDFALGVHNHDGVYAPAAHDHNDRYYTETELQSSGSASVHWDNLSNVPADIADGDDNTQLTEAQVDNYVSNNGYLDGSSALDWSNITINMPEGFADGVDDVGGVPSGVIAMWSGAIGNIPTGWALCDGGVHNGVQTPDLTSMFIRSIPNALTEPGLIGGSLTHSHSAGSYTASSHTHSYSGTTDSGGGNHCSDKGGSCSHISTKAHTHTCSGTTNSGGGGSISGASAEANNLPPYFALAFIMHTGE